MKPDPNHLRMFNAFRGAAGNAALYGLRLRMFAECVASLAAESKSSDPSRLTRRVIESFSELSPEATEKLERAERLHSALLPRDLSDAGSTLGWLQRTVEDGATQESARIFTEAIQVLDELLKLRSN